MFHVLYVDNDPEAFQIFLQTAALIPGKYDIRALDQPDELITYVKNSTVDMIFLNIDMPGFDGPRVTEKLKKQDVNLKIVFLSAYGNYALDAFRVNALGYLLKPYTAAQLQKEFDKAALIRPVPRRHVFFRTLPNFDVYVDGALLPIASSKPKELLALLVDRNGSAVTPGNAISCLWENKLNDSSTKSLYRMTFKRLRELLASHDIDFIIGSNGSQRYLKTDMVDSDYARLLKGDPEFIHSFAGQYMKEYSWAEETTARLAKVLYGEQL